LLKGRPKGLRWSGKSTKATLKKLFLLFPVIQYKGYSLLLKRAIIIKQTINYIMAIAKIIWVDDEIESLQSQKLFLENKGYEVQTFRCGADR
jgi:hypothetical protein